MRSLPFSSVTSPADTQTIEKSMMLIGGGYLVRMKPEGRSRWSEREKEEPEKPIVPNPVLPGFTLNPNF